MMRLNKHDTNDLRQCSVQKLKINRRRSENKSAEVAPAARLRAPRLAQAVGHSIRVQKRVLRFVSKNMLKTAQQDTRTQKKNVHQLLMAEKML
jgi:hypothetical protein